MITGPSFTIAIATSMSLSGWNTRACWTGAVAILCVIWWILEPIPVTSLIPLTIFPWAGVLPKEEIAKTYGSDLVLLMLGGFMISAAMAHSGAHHRLALALIRLVGGSSSRRIVWGFMCICAILSMWISIPQLP